jgi:hypothetical protein
LEADNLSRIEKLSHVSVPRQAREVILVVALAAAASVEVLVVELVELEEPAELEDVSSMFQTFVPPQNLSL